MEKLYTVSKIRLGVDCGSDHELLIAKFRLKLKKVEKTIRPLRYDLKVLDFLIPYWGFFPLHVPHRGLVEGGTGIYIQVGNGTE